MQRQGDKSPELDHSTKQHGPPDIATMDYSQLSHTAKKLKLLAGYGDGGILPNLLN